MSEEKPKGRAVKPKYEVVCDNKDYLTALNFDFKWLESLSKEYDFSQFQYIHKFRAFRCYKNNQHVDWIDINDLALLNGKRRLDEIRLKHQTVSPKRAVIEYPWR
tara:strand:+ start:228 stop:542 length:315 start_codon:yes stop_codon:yes gene_type:complete